MGVSTRSLPFGLIFLLKNLDIVTAYCYSHSSCNTYPNNWCCTSQSECCTFEDYTGNTFDDDDVREIAETSGKIAVGIVVAIVIAIIIAIVACIVGCVICCRRNSNRQGQVVGGHRVVTTTTTVHAGQPGQVQQGGYQLGQQQPKVHYPPSGPAPPYVPPGQPMQPPPYQPGYPPPMQGAPPQGPPYAAGPGYPPMPTPHGQPGAAPYPAAPGPQPGAAPYPVGPGPQAQPAYAPQQHLEMQPQHQYPTKDSVQASAPPMS
ncbi:uncharacterized protein LOC120333439 [Styela clava]